MKQREIKFRAWDKKKKVMRMVCAEDLRSESFDLFARFPEDMELHDLMQFTGLKDKRRRGIYEGDILRIGGRLAPVEVYYESPAFVVEDDLSEGAYVLNPLRVNEYEIIGNIYENPELLKK